MKEFLKKNKFLFVLPLVLLPFVVLIFYILGGGNPKDVEQNQLANPNTSGANYIIPEAEKSIEIYDKLEAYQRENIEAKIDYSESVDTILSSKTDSVSSGDGLLPLLAEKNNQLPEQLLAHIKEKERQIQAELNTEITENPQQVIRTKNSYQPKLKKEIIQVKLEKEIQSTGIEQLDKVFDENITLSRENDSLKFFLQQARNKLQLVEAKKNAGFVVERKNRSGFDNNDNQSQLIAAEIYETTTVLDGNRVKLRLLEDTYVNGEVIKRNTFVYGTCKIKNERLHISITQMPTHKNFVQVKLSIYDLDGMEGLYVPNNVARKVYREVGASTNTSSLMGVSTDPFAYAGVRAADRTAQTLLKRIRLKKVTVKKNTLVYLINQK